MNGNIKNKFGLKDGKIITIEDISPELNGLKCGCLCPNCFEPFIARMGDKKIHHFAHSNKGCDELNAYMKGLYMLINDYIKEGYKIYLPAVIAAFELSEYSYITKSNVKEKVKLLSYSIWTDREIRVREPLWLSFKKSSIETDSYGKPCAIIVQFKNKTLAIKLTPPDTICKEATVSKYKNFPTLNIDFSSFDYLINNSKRDEIFKVLSDENEVKSLYSWVYNPLVENAYPKIMIRSKEYYDKVKENNAKKQSLIIKESKTNQSKGTVKQKNIDETPKETADQKAKLKEEQYQKGYNEVCKLFVQNETQIIDSYGVRWIKCEICGEIKPKDYFWRYGGKNKNNLGKCNQCKTNGRL